MTHEVTRTKDSRRADITCEGGNRGAPPRDARRARYRARYRCRVSEHSTVRRSVARLRTARWVRSQAATPSNIKDTRRVLQTARAARARTARNTRTECASARSRATRGSAARGDAQHERACDTSRRPSTSSCVDIILRHSTRSSSSTTGAEALLASELVAENDHREHDELLATRHGCHTGASM